MDQAETSGIERVINRELRERFGRFDDPDAAAPRIVMADDGALAAERLPVPGAVTTTLALLRANYVFPEVADRAAAAVEARSRTRCRRSAGPR